MQELRKTNLKRSGAGVEDIYVSSWPYFYALKFIQASAEDEASTSNLKFIVENDCEEKHDEVVENPAEPLTRKRKMNQNKATIVDEDIQKAHNILQQPNDPEQLFGDYVASELRNLKYSENKRKLKHLINRAIMQVSDVDASEMNSSNTPTTSNYSILSATLTAPSLLSPIEGA